MLSRRERIIAILAITALGALVLDAYVLGPLEDWRDRLDADRAEYTAQLAAADRLFAARAQSDRRWRDMLDAGLADNPSTAEYRLLNAIRAAAEDARLAIASTQPERAARDGSVGQVVVRTAASGDIEGVARFVYLLENAEIPARIHRLRIAGAESGGSLSLDARISTIYLEPGQSDQERGP